MPVLPSVWSVVLNVSIGVRTMRHAAAARLANMVLTSDGRSFKTGLDCNSANIPTFAAASPNRDIGPARRVIHWEEFRVEDRHALNEGITQAAIIPWKPSFTI